MSFNPVLFFENGRTHLHQNSIQLHLNAGALNSYPGSGTTWTDISGNGRNGVLTNGPTFSSGNGGSILFDGVNDYVGGTGMDNLSTGLNGSSGVSIEFWLKRSALSGVGNRVFFGFSNTAGTHKLILFFNPTDKLIVGSRSANEASVQARTTVNSFTNTTNWYHIIGTISYSTNTINIYVNGALESSTGTVSFAQSTLANGTANTFNRIGSEVGGGTTCFNGNIAHVRVYKKVLSDSNILGNFNRHKNKFGL